VVLITVELGMELAMELATLIMEEDTTLTLVMGATKTLMALMVKTRAMVQSIQVATTDLEDSVAVIRTEKDRTKDKMRLALPLVA